MKLNKSDVLEPLVYKLLVVMAQLELPKPGSRSQYTKSMLLNLMILKYHKLKQDCIWRMWKKDPGVFNEDVGETFLSALARSINGRPNKHDIDFVREQYWMVKTYSVVSDCINRYWGHECRTRDEASSEMTTKPFSPLQRIFGDC